MDRQIGEATYIFVTGAGGFIGGSVLSQLRASQHPLIKHAQITGLVRSNRQALLLRSRNFLALEVDKENLDLAPMRYRGAGFDLVINCGDSSDVASARDLILGLGDSKRRNGRQGYYIHTTGVSSLAHGTISQPDATIRDFSDLDDVYGEEVRREGEQPYEQRAIDRMVIESAETNEVKAYMMMLPTVYGNGLGHFNKQSLHVPLTIRTALERGRAEYIGDGSGTAGYVHVQDMASLYELLVGKILEGADLPTGRKGVEGIYLPEGSKGIYFSNTGSYTWKGLTEAVGRAGVKLGALQSAIPASVSLDEAAQEWNFLGDRLSLELNHAGKSKTTPKLAFQLGWEPTKTEQDWEAHIEEAFNIVLARREALAARLAERAALAAKTRLSN